MRNTHTGHRQMNWINARRQKIHTYTHSSGKKTYFYESARYRLIVFVCSKRIILHTRWITSNCFEWKKRNFPLKKRSRTAINDLDSVISFPMARHNVRHHLDKHIIMELESGAEYSSDNKTRKEKTRISRREKEMKELYTDKRKENETVKDGPVSGGWIMLYGRCSVVLWCSGREQRAKEREKRHPRQAAVIRPSPMIVAADDDDNITGTVHI